MMKVVLVGYMGCGKSMIGKLLSEKTELNFLDLDEIIEKEENCTIKKIFECKGEVYFRKKEHLIFKDLMQNENSFILSLGGGTPCYSNNHELLLNENAVSVYLSASIDTLYSRLLLEKSKRPILADKSESELKDFIAKHLFDRSYYYNQSKFKVDVNNKSANEILLEILKILA